MKLPGSVRGQNPENPWVTGPHNVLKMFLPVQAPSFLWFWAHWQSFGAGKGAHTGPLRDRMSMKTHALTGPTQALMGSRLGLRNPYRPWMGSQDWLLSVWIWVFPSPYEAYRHLHGPVRFPHLYFTEPVTCTYRFLQSRSQNYTENP